ncbi:Protein TolB [Morella rubra]|uniref:Protein TolB n=1 Tax=Morella rubra TaxID=262757 RepID=A0A6A1UGW2_9ROSI|nr:Protein TolB [Morella rubra]
MHLLLPLCFLLNFSLLLVYAAAYHESPSSSSIIFATLGRLDYAFDVFALPALDPPSVTDEIRITDGQSVNFNGHFPPSSALLSPLLTQSGIQTRVRTETPSLQLIYVTERNGTSNIYYDAVYGDGLRSPRLRSTLEVSERVQIRLLGSVPGKQRISMKDKPSLTGEGMLVYVSTHEDTGEPRTSWAAVYSTDLTIGLTKRLTPYGVADFSPAVSPSGVWTAVASYGEKGWDGEVEELNTDIYVLLTRDGTQRVKAVEHGGWPCWVDESTLYFHRRGDDKWWSIYRAKLPVEGPITTESVVVERVTPPGLHAFTPATSPGNKNFIAVATRRANSKFRHIELFDVVKNEFKELTRLVSPQTHHFNPFISPDSTQIGYHRCRGKGTGRKSTQLLLENILSPMPELSLFRIDGSFPSFSPTGDQIAYVDFPGVYVVNWDGSNRRQIYPETSFSTAWDPVRKGIVYTSTGPTFAPESAEVDIISIDINEVDGASFKKLTTDGKNNAFPSLSPDGKWIVFRSGRSGHKNLYIMDAVEGDRGALHRLTEGPWSDTMCSWSPDGDWIAFASDRENPGSGSFELYLIHPNKTGLKKLFRSGSGGRANHQTFSLDGKSIMFTSDYGAVSAEPISNPHHYQPYGEIFTMKLDGSDLRRLTQNSFEDGTPAWSPAYIKPADVEWPKGGPRCSFEDCHWLNEMPKDDAGIALTRPQCGAP